MVEEDFAWKESEILETAGHFRETARTTFLGDGHHSPMTFLFAVTNPQTGGPEKTISVIPAQKFDEAGKNMYTAVLRKAAHQFKATGLIFITEAWLLRTDMESKQTPEEAEREHRKWMKEHESLEFHPKRMEVLMMTVETSRYGCYVWMAEIMRDAEGKPSLKDWEQQDRRATHEGRFVHLLPQMS